MLRSALHRAGLRFRLHRRGLPGTPDMVLPRHRIAVFADGDFWHGRLGIPKSNQAYWRAKFRANRARDRRADRQLAASGWRVARVWESDISADPAACAARILSLAGRTTES